LKREVFPSQYNMHGGKCVNESHQPLVVQKKKKKKNPESFNCSSKRL